MISRAALLFAICVVTCGVARSANADCVDVQNPGNLAFEGTLTFQVFPPSLPTLARYQDVMDPSYILKLEKPICIIGDAFVAAGNSIDRIELLSDASDLLPHSFRKLVGLHVVVTGEGVIGAHTTHQHAPLLMLATDITAATSTDGYGGPTDVEGSAMTTVQGFYVALAAGDGKEAAKFVSPGKRRSGSLSASRLTSVYGGLVEPLALLEIVPLRADEYRVRYTFIPRRSGRCEGAAIVHTKKIDGADLIASIKPINGC